MTVVVDVRRGADSLACARGPIRAFLFLRGRPASGVGLGSRFRDQCRRRFGAQPIAPGSHRAEIVWHGPHGTAARIASALVAFSTVRFEVTEDLVEGLKGSGTPSPPTWAYSAARSVCTEMCWSTRSGCAAARGRPRGGHGSRPRSWKK